MKTERIKLNSLERVEKNYVSLSWVEMKDRGTWEQRSITDEEKAKALVRLLGMEWPLRSVS